MRRSRRQTEYTVGGISMEQNLPDVHRIWRGLTRSFGETFPVSTIITLIEISRGKPLRIEQDSMPLKMSGYCIALHDVDLVCTRAGADPVQQQATLLHELAHLLLGHVPHLSGGPSTPTYAVFKRNRDKRTASCRDHTTAYEAPQEYAAEALATLLADSITRHARKIPQFAKDFYGYTE